MLPVYYLYTKLEPLKVTTSPIKFEDDKMKNVSRYEHSGEYTCDMHACYEKLSDEELKLTFTIDDQSAVYIFKKCDE